MQVFCRWGVGGWQWIKEWVARGVYGLQGERQACIPCKVDCSLHLTGCTNCIVPSPFTPPPPPPRPTSLTTPSIFPSPLLPPFHPPALQIVSKITLYCRVSPQSRLHLSVHIPDCEKAAGELEGEAGGDLGLTFS